MRQMIDFRDYLIEKFSDIDKALYFLEVALEEYEKDPDGAALYYGFSAAVEGQGGVQKFALKTHSTPQAVSDALLSKDEIQIAELLKKQVLARRGKDKNIAQNEALPKWKKVFISEVAKVVTGKTPPTAVKSNYDGKVPFVSPADLGSTKYIQCAQKTLSIKGSKLSPVIPAGSTLFTCIGSTIGKTGIASIELRTNQQINSAIPNNIDEEYLYYALSFISPKIKKLAAVQAIPIINKTGFENQIIRIPECRNIQKAIASLLEKWDTAIEKTEALIEAKEKRFKWLLKTLISDQQDNPEWREVQLGEFMEFKNGLNTRKENYGSGIKFVNVMDVFSHNYLYANDVIGSVQATKKQRVGYSVKYGDVLFNRTSETFEEIALSSVYLDKKEIIFGGFVIRGRQKSNILIPEYSAYCFQAYTVRRELIRRGQGAVRANIGQKDLSKIPVVIPPVNEQKVIASLLNKSQGEIDLLKQLTEQYRTQKRGLMQKLLTGKWRVKEEKISCRT